MVGNVVKVVNTESVSQDYLGRYGIVTEKAYGDKWWVEFIGKVGKGKPGSLTHTVKQSDFEVVGKIDSNR